MIVQKLKKRTVDFLASSYVSMVTNIIMGTGALFHCALFVNMFFLSLFFPFEHRDWGEFDNLFVSYLLGNQENIYSLADWSHATSIPYTFFYPLILSPIIHFFGPHLIVGRALSLVSYCGIICLTYLTIIKRFHTPKMWALYGVLCAISLQALLGHTMQKFHPNSFAIFLGILSLYVTPQKSSPKKKWIFAFSIALLSCYTKQPGILFLGSILIAGWKIEGIKILYPFSMVAGIGVLIALFVNIITDNGFFFYCLRIPSQVYFFKLRHFHRVLFFVIVLCFSLIFPLFLYIKNKRYMDSPYLYAGLLGIPLCYYAFMQNGGTRSSFSFVLFPLCSIGAASLYLFVQSGNQASKSLRLLIAKSNLIYLLLVSNLIWPVGSRIPTIISWPKITVNDATIANHIETLFFSAEREVLALTNRLQALHAKKKIYTSSEFMRHLRILGIHRFPEIEEKLKKKQFSLVLVPSRFIIQHIQEEKFKIKQLLLDNYAPTDTLFSHMYTHPAIIFKPKKHTF